MKLPDVDQIKRFLLQLPLVTTAVAWAKTHSFPGAYGVPLYDVMVFVWNEMLRTDVLTRANAVAYSFFISIFPAIIALFTFLPVVNYYLLGNVTWLEDLNFTLVEEIGNLVPSSMGEVLVELIEDIILNPRFGLFSIGFLLAFYFGTNGMQALMQGFEKSYPATFRQRSFLRKQGVALLLTLVLGLMLLLSGIFIIVGDQLIYWITDIAWLSEQTLLLLTLTRWVVIILLVYSAISIIYRYGAATHIRFKFVSPGATVATLLSILASILFAVYLNKFNTYNKLYGGIGAIVAFLIWIQLNVMVLLVGFELNASISVNRDLKQKPIEE